MGSWYALTMLNPLEPGKSESGTGTFLARSPDIRDLYVLLAGIFLGVCLGPGVLGRLAPGTYDRLFLGTGEALAQVKALDAQRLALRERLRDTGASDVAAQELGQGLREYSRGLERVQRSRRAHLQHLRGRLSTVLLALVVAMVLEALLGPSHAWVQSILGTMRYALGALWLMLVLAQPALLGPVSWVLVVLLLSVSGGAALVSRERPGDPGAPGTKRRWGA